MVNFEREGVVSIWVFLKVEDPANAEKDVLKEFCGVEDYDLDFQEGNLSEGGQKSLRSLLKDVTHSSSFIDEAVAAAKKLGVTKALGVIVQFDFAYDPAKAKKKKIAADPLFIGYFPFEDDV